MYRPTIRSLVSAPAVLGCVWGLVAINVPDASAQSRDHLAPGSISESEVREAIHLLHSYLAQQNDAAAQTAREPTFDRDRTLAADVVGEDAPALGDASLAIDGQLHLANSSAVFKNGDLFLWDDPVGTNLALGREALSSATGTSTQNLAIGPYALQNTSSGAGATEGSFNLAVGANALQSNGLGAYNTAVGFSALTSNSFGLLNTAVGHAAMQSNFDGHGNTATGGYVLSTNTSGYDNTATGRYAMYLNEDGDRNTAAGRSALLKNTSGSTNTAIGAYALFNNVSGSSNISIGNGSGLYALNTASDNIFIGNDGTGVGGTPTIMIGTEGTQTRAFIAGIQDNMVSGTPVEVTASGELGIGSDSARRLKRAIQDLGEVEDLLARLRPVTYRYDPELVTGGGGPMVGLIAEEVAEVFPELVTLDAEGNARTVRYELLSVLLLEEVQRLAEVHRQEKARLDGFQHRLGALEQARPPGGG